MPQETVTIAGMPEIWSSDISFFPSDVSAAFAKWAVKQSPFCTPQNLTNAIEYVQEHAETWVEREDFQAPQIRLVRLNCREVHKRLEEFFERTPVIEAWNHPKSGKEQAFYGGDRQGNYQSPDDDIIDLGALARNVAHDLALWHIYDRAHD
jgi:hypothetical protein